MTLSQALIGETVRPRDRGRYQGYLAAVAVSANTFGPVAGGYLTEHLGWPSIFLINLPLGLIAVLLTLRLKARPGMRTGKRFDYPGLLLFVLFVASALLALEQIQQMDAKALPVIFGLVAIAIGALVPAAPTFGAAAGLDPPEATAGVAVGDVCALVPPRPGASRCTLRRNFIPRKPITKTTTPTMRGIGETRLVPPVAAGRRRTTGAETGFARSFSCRYE